MVNMDNYQKLVTRLQQITNHQHDRRNDRPGPSSNASIIGFKIYVQYGELKGWTKPTCTPLEPCPFDITMFQLEPVPGGWVGVLLSLKRQQTSELKELVVREDGTPAGWFVGERVRV